MSAIDPNTVFVVLGSIAVSAVTAGPLWIANRKANKAGAASQGSTADSLEDLRAVVVEQGMATLTSVHRLERKFDAHVKDPHAHSPR